MTLAVAAPSLNQSFNQLSGGDECGVVMKVCGGDERSGDDDLDKSIIKVKDVEIGSGFKYIFGPCSIESEEQIKEVAKYLSDNGYKFIRGGAFKPRTSPYDFQGLGVEGLRILSKIAKEYNLFVVIEVMVKRSVAGVIPVLKKKKKKKNP